MGPRRGQNAAMTPTWQTLTEQVTRELAGAGIDLVAPMQVGWYNAAEPPEIRLPEPAGPGSLALVLGNTGALWQPFCASLRRHPGRLARPNPLEHHVERAIARAAGGLAPAPSVHLGHGPAGRSYSLQRAAVASGLCAMAPCHLVIHRRVGLWLGLRGVLVFAAAGPERRVWGDPSPCESCADKPCLPLLRRALDGGSSPPRSIRQRWEPWLAVRDACPVGREHRYCDDQVRYHYAVERSILARCTLNRGDGESG